MVSIHVDIEKLEWKPGSAKYGAVAVHDGKEIIQSAVLSDRRQEGGGVGLLSKVSPPPGKLVKIVLVDRSDDMISTSKADGSRNPGVLHMALVPIRSNP